jgi:hypothetical protein
VRPKWLALVLWASLAGNAVELAIPAARLVRWWVRADPSLYESSPWQRNPERHYDRVMLPEFEWTMDSLNHESLRLLYVQDSLVDLPQYESLGLAQNADSLERLDRQRLETTFRSCRAGMEQLEGVEREQMMRRWRAQMALVGK